VLANIKAVNNACDGRVAAHGIDRDDRALVPRPRINLILYHGVLGPRAAWRAEVVQHQTSETGDDAGVKDSATEGAREALIPPRRRGVTLAVSVGRR
jgi:hypothetical protein